MHPLCVLEEGSDCAYRFVEDSKGNRIQVFCPKHAHEAKCGSRVSKQYEMLPEFVENMSPVRENHGIKEPIHRLFSSIPDAADGSVGVPTRDSDANTAGTCLLYTSPSPRDGLLSRMPSSA